MPNESGGMVEIDGSFGEGGGQLLRTALFFSVICKRPIHVTNIRAGRQVPGLKPQHAAVLRILADICGGSLEGGRVGSLEVFFAPREIRRHSVSIDLGTAASITLVLQALIPAVALSGTPFRAEFTGGTDVPWSPTCDYMARLIQPAFRRVGVEFEFTVSRRGFYPRGGGRVEASVAACPGVKPLLLPPLQGTGTASVISRCSGLPRHVAERQAASASSLLRQKGLGTASVSVSVDEASSPGSSVLVYLAEEGRYIGADALGRRGLPAESVGESAAAKFAEEVSSGASLDENLADTVAPVLCMSSSPSEFHVPSVSEHLKTSLHVARMFTGAEYRFERGGVSGLWAVKVSPGQQNS